MVSLLRRKKRWPQKLIRRLSVSVLSQPYDRTLQTGKEPCSRCFTHKILVKLLPCLSKTRTTLHSRAQTPPKNQTLIPGLRWKMWLLHLLFSFTWTLCKWTHSSHISVTTTQQDFTTHVTSATEASANGYHTREIWRASIHSHMKEGRGGRKKKSQQE